MYDVIVDNIGNVYSGKSRKQAMEMYNHYTTHIANGESVALMFGGGLVREFTKHVCGACERRIRLVEHCEVCELDICADCAKPNHDDLGLIWCVKCVEKEAAAKEAHGGSD